jgi:hypothetical protein
MARSAEADEARSGTSRDPVAERVLDERLQQHVWNRAREHVGACVDRHGPNSTTARPRIPRSAFVQRAACDARRNSVFAAYSAITKRRTCSATAEASSTHGMCPASFRIWSVAWGIISAIRDASAGPP